MWYIIQSFINTQQNTAERFVMFNNEEETARKRKTKNQILKTETETVLKLKLLKKWKAIYIDLLNWIQLKICWVLNIITSLTDSSFIGHCSKQIKISMFA